MVKNIYLDTNIYVYKPFYDARELIYSLKWPWTQLLALLLVLVYIWLFWNCSNQLSMVKNIYVDTKIGLLWCQGAVLHLEVALDPVIGIVIGVGVYLEVV